MEFVGGKFITLIGWVGEPAYYVWLDVQGSKSLRTSEPGSGVLRKVPFTESPVQNSSSEVNDEPTGAFRFRS